MKSLEESLPLYRDVLGLPLASIESVEAEEVRVAMLSSGEGRIELLEATAQKSPIARFLQSRGPGLHHVAIRVPDLQATVAELRRTGSHLLNEPRTGAGGHQYVFVHPRSTGGVLLELIQE